MPGKHRTGLTSTVICQFTDHADTYNFIAASWFDRKSTTLPPKGKRPPTRPENLKFKFNLALIKKFECKAYRFKSTEKASSAAQTIAIYMVVSTGSLLTVLRKSISTKAYRLTELTD